MFLKSIDGTTNSLVSEGDVFRDALRDGRGGLPRTLAADATSASNLRATLIHRDNHRASHKRLALFAFPIASGSFPSHSYWSQGQCSDKL